MGSRCVWISALTLLCASTAWPQVGSERVVQAVAGVHTFSVRVRVQPLATSDRVEGWAQAPNPSGERPRIRLNGQPVFARRSDREPATRFTQFEVWRGAERWPLPEALWADCTDPEIDAARFVLEPSKDGRRLVVRMNAVDAGGGYRVVWLLGENQTPQRFVDELGWVEPPGGRRIVSRNGSDVAVVTLTKRPFEPRGRVVQGQPARIDGQPVPFFDDLPFAEMASFEVEVNGRRWMVPRSLWADCFEPNLGERSLWAWLANGGDRLVIKMIGGRRGTDGVLRSSYSVLWTLQSDGSHTRELTDRTSD